MPNNDGFASTWEFENTHVDTNINPAKDLISAAKCIIYAKPSAFGTGDTSTSSKFYRCGLIQGYGFQEQKDVNRIFELGSGVPYLIPGRTTGSLSLNRVMLFGADLVNILYYSAQNEGITNEELFKSNVEAINGENNTERIIRSISEISVPVDLLFTYYKSTGETGEAAKTSTKYSRVFKECQITARSESVDANSIMVLEGVQLMYSKMGPVKLG